MAGDNLIDEEEHISLVPGQTIIGKELGEYKGSKYNFTYYYGNHVEPLLKDENGYKYLKLKKEEYETLLDKFLLSDEGSAFDKPSKADLKKAYQFVLNLEKEKLDEKNKIIETKEIKEIENKEKSSSKEEKEIIDSQIDLIEQIDSQNIKIKDLEGQLNKTTNELLKLNKKREKEKLSQLKEIIKLKKTKEKVLEESLLKLVSCCLILQSLILLAIALFIK